MSKAFQILLNDIVNIHKLLRDSYIENKLDMKIKCNFCWKPYKECSDDHKDDIRQWILMENMR
jgi:hypothetical protein